MKLLNVGLRVLDEMSVTVYVYNHDSTYLKISSVNSVKTNQTIDTEIPM